MIINSILLYIYLFLLTHDHYLKHYIQVNIVLTLKFSINVLLISMLNLNINRFATISGQLSLTRRIIPV